MRARYRNDCIYNFFYAPIETEAWGGEVVYSDSGPPNSGTPLIQHPEDIPHLSPPDVTQSPCLAKVLDATRMLKADVGDEVPIIGVVMSPFSLPVMQLGFDRYIELLYERPDLFKLLMKKNETFCIEWANAQLDAGATAICYFDPVSSPTMTPRDIYLNTGFKVARRTLSGINGPTATHLASGRCLPIVDDLVETGTAVVGTSVLENLSNLKSACQKKLCVLGNLNGIEMCRWTPEETEKNVKDAIANAGPGGGFILSDNHGEIPWQVPDNVLMAVSDAVQKWGQYPLDWADTYGR